MDDFEWMVLEGDLSGGRLAHVKFSQVSHFSMCGNGWWNPRPASVEHKHCPHCTIGVNSRLLKRLGSMT